MIGVSTSNWIATLKVGRPLSSGTIGGRFDGSVLVLDAAAPLLGSEDYGARRRAGT